MRGIAPVSTELGQWLDLILGELRVGMLDGLGEHLPAKTGTPA
jgi:hypothetical protein